MRRHSVLALASDWRIADDLAVSLAADDVCVRVCHTDERTFATRFDTYGAIEGKLAFAKLDGYDIFCQISTNILAVCIIYRSDAFESSLLVARNYTRRDSRLDTAHSVGVRHGHAHCILDQISADLDFYPLGHFAEKSTRGCRCISKRDRLGASHSGHKFLAENIQICGIEFTVHLFFFFSRLFFGHASLKNATTALGYSLTL